MRKKIKEVVAWAVVGSAEIHQFNNLSFSFPAIFWNKHFPQVAKDEAKEFQQLWNKKAKIIKVRITPIKEKRK